MNLSKLQSEAVKEFDKRIPTLEPDKMIGEEVEFGYKYRENDGIHTVTDWGNIKQFLCDQLAKYYLEGIEIGREEERIFVMAIYHKAVEELFNKEIADNITKQAGIVYKKYKLSIQSKGKMK